MRRAAGPKTTGSSAATPTPRKTLLARFGRLHHGPPRSAARLSASAVTTTCSACLRARASWASASFSAILIWTSRIRELRLHLSLGLGLVQHPQGSGRPPLASNRSRPARAKAAASAKLLEQRLDLAAGLLRIGLADQARPRIRCRSCGTSVPARCSTRTESNRDPAAVRASSACGPRRGNTRSASGPASA